LLPLRFVGREEENDEWGDEWLMEENEEYEGEEEGDGSMHRSMRGRGRATTAPDPRLRTRVRSPELTEEEVGGRMLIVLCVSPGNDYCQGF
jgi:hypothetical protein